MAKFLTDEGETDWQNHGGQNDKPLNLKTAFCRIPLAAYYLNTTIVIKAGLRAKYPNENKLAFGNTKRHSIDLW